MNPVRLTVLRWAYRLAGWPRWVLAGVLVVAAAVTTLASHAGPPAAAAPSVPLLVATRSLPVAHVLRTGDLRLMRWPRPLAPTGALSSTAAAVGRTLAGGLTAGEALTSARLRGSGVTAGLPASMVAATVTLRTAAGANFLRPGDRVDLVRAPLADDAAGDPGADSSSVPSSRARVLVPDVAVLAPDTTDGVVSLLVAVDSAQALVLASNSGSVLATLRPAQ